jgi:hypothetical protein
MSVSSAPTAHIFLAPILSLFFFSRSSLASSNRLGHLYYQPWVNFILAQALEGAQMAGAAAMEWVLQAWTYAKPHVHAAYAVCEQVGR